jgi:glucose 1-dehydrogenase
MRAVAVVPGERDSLHLRDVPAPEPAPSQVLVRVLEAGVCGTDAEIQRGDLGRAPDGCPYLVLGHENLGRVESAPDGARVRAGDLVVATVRRPCLPPCTPCAAGRQDLCATGAYLERGIVGLHGFMSDRYTESPAFLIAVPSALRAVAILVEPMAVVEKGLEQALLVLRRVPGSPRRALVMGAGPIGLLAALALRLRGVPVVVASLEPEGSPRASLLAAAGIAYASTSSAPLDRLEPCDLVLEATGAAGVILPALRRLDRNGVAVLASVASEGRRQEFDVGAWNNEMMLGNRSVIGTVNAERRHFEAAVLDLASAEDRFPGWAARLVTRRLPYQEAAHALERQPDDIKTVLDFGEA